MNKTNEFINSITNNNTKTSYTNALKHFFTCYSHEELINNFRDTLEKLKNNNNLSNSIKQMICRALAKYLSYIHEYPDEKQHQMKNFMIYYKEKQELNKKIKQYPPLHSLQDKWRNIKEDNEEDLKNKIILDFYLNYPPLRSDLFIVKLKNYDKSIEPHIHDGLLVVPKCVKTNKTIPSVILSSKTMELLKAYQIYRQPRDDYLIPMNNTPDEKRNLLGRPSNLLATISSVYLNCYLTINDFRKIHVLYHDEQTHNSKSEKFKTMNNLSNKMGHTYLSQQQFYNVDQ